MLHLKQYKFSLLKKHRQTTALHNLWTVGWSEVMKSLDCAEYLAVNNAYQLIVTAVWCSELRLVTARTRWGGHATPTTSRYLLEISRTFLQTTICETSLKV